MATQRRKSRILLAIAMLGTVAATGCQHQQHASGCAPGCATNLPDSACYGYQSSCWYPWPEECRDCNDVMREQSEAAREQPADPPAGEPMQPTSAGRVIHADTVASRE